MVVSTRSRRTRQRIADALIESYAENGALPSVGELAMRANIARSSFYVHFDSIEAVMAMMLADEMELISELGRVGRQGGIVSGEASTRDLLAATLGHVESRAGLYVLLLSAESVARGNAVADVIATTLQASMVRDGAEQLVRPPVIEASATALGHALSALLALWLTGAWAGTRDELLDVMASLLPAWTQALRTT